MKDQVLSAEQMLELIDMGIDVSKASMCWRRSLNYVTDEWCIDGLIINNNFSHSLEYIPTFTLQDILLMLPTHTTFSEDYSNDKCFGRYWVRLVSFDNANIHTELSNKSLLEAAFNMLKWCKENKTI